MGRICISEHWTRWVNTLKNTMNTTTPTGAQQAKTRKPRGGGVPVENRKKTGKVIRKGTMVKVVAENGKQLFAQGNKSGGRPAGVKNHGGLGALLREVLAETTTTKDGREISNARAVIEALVEKAKKKDVFASQLVFERSDGKVTQKVEGRHLVQAVQVTIVKKEKS